MNNSEKIRELFSSTQVQIIALILFGCISIFYYFMTSASYSLTEANNIYHEGERASSIEQRNSAFNKALALYMESDKKYDPVYGNGKIYYNIANTFFQLEEYPSAILYYYRSLRLRPGDRNISDNLDQALKKMEIVPQKESFSVKEIFFLHHYISLPGRLQVFFLFSLLGFICLSFYILGKKPLLKYGTVIFLVLAGFFLPGILYSLFLQNTEGVVMSPTAIYRGSGKQFAKVIETPLKAGLKVSVLESDDKGEWLKIEDEKTIGYVESSSVRLI